MKGLRTKRAWGLRIAAAAWLSASSVNAQLASEPTDTSRDASRDVAAAARAFQEGQKAQLASDFARAAQMFELAHQLAPTPEALRSTIRNYDAAGEPARAATLALRALRRYPSDPETTLVAQPLIDRVSPELSRVTIACDEPCTLQLDRETITNEPVTRVEAFTQPGTRQLIARFEDGREVTATLELFAAARTERALIAPSPEPARPLAQPEVIEPPPIARHEVIVPPPPVRAPESEHQGLSPWYVASAGALTLVTATAATAFGLDALRKRDAYEAEPTRARYEDGVESQKWTNALWLAAGGLAATSFVLLAFTDWEGEQQRSTAALSISPLAANFVVRSSLP